MERVQNFRLRRYLCDYGADSERISRHTRNTTQTHQASAGVCQHRKAMALRAAQAAVGPPRVTFYNKYILSLISGGLLLLGGASKPTDKVNRFLPLVWSMAYTWVGSFTRKPTNRRVVVPITTKMISRTIPYIESSTQESFRCVSDRRTAVSSREPQRGRWGSKDTNGKVETTL